MKQIQNEFGEFLQSLFILILIIALHTQYTMDSPVYMMNVTYEVSTARSPSSSPSSAPLPSYVLFNYILETYHSIVIQPLTTAIPRTVLHEYAQLPFPTTHRCIDHHTLLFCSDRSRRIIMATLSQLLSNYPLLRLNCDRIVNQILSLSQRACMDVYNAGTEIVPINFRIRVDHVHTYAEMDWIQPIPNDTVIENSMVPASERSILELKKKRITQEDFKNSNVGTCTVCLEDFVSGTEVTCMPCSHVFHEECIVSWLKTSHYCPVCRFEVSTEDHEVDEQSL